VAIFKSNQALKHRRSLLCFTDYNSAL